VWGEFVSLDRCVQERAVVLRDSTQQREIFKPGLTDSVEKANVAWRWNARVAFQCCRPRERETVVRGASPRKQDTGYPAINPALMASNSKL
jgi:hypothetical protein